MRRKRAAGLLPILPACSCLGGIAYSNSKNSKWLVLVWIESVKIPYKKHPKHIKMRVCWQREKNATADRVLYSTI